MSIEARGAKQAYAVVIHAIATERRADAIVNHHRYAKEFLAADSEDEAYGRAVRSSEESFPESEGWIYRHVVMSRIDNFDWIDRRESVGGKVVKRPW